MAANPKEGGPDTQEPDQTSERPPEVEQQDQQFPKQDVKDIPLKSMPQVPEVNQPVRPGHRDREQI